MAPTAEGPPAAVVRASRSSSNDGENIINRKATTSPSPTTSLGRHHDHLHKTTVSSSSAYVSHPRLSSRYSFHMRWLVLTLNCTLLFGNYYAYDLPAALNTPLQAYLQVDDAEYQVIRKGVQ